GTLTGLLFVPVNGYKRRDSQHNLTEKWWTKNISGSKWRGLTAQKPIWCREVFRQIKISVLRGVQLARTCEFRR
ncbi:MAG: hypothetical protein ACOCWJ_04765, partial [Verrucomicrobiota bacterium]